MDQSKKKPVSAHDGQTLYLGRWVDKKHFRTFVYNEKGDQKLAESFLQYESLIASGLWFAMKPDPEIVPQGKRKKINDAAIPNGQ